jgi:hypothetical protein
MTAEPPPPDDFVDLYRRAFAQYGTHALWNMRPIEDPTPADALAITKALRTHGGMEGRRLAEQIERLCRGPSLNCNPTRSLQRDAALTVIAGGVALNREGSRFSRDIDIFQDSEEHGKYRRRSGARGGVWPSSAEISTAMLERYDKPGGLDPKP